MKNIVALREKANKIKFLCPKSTWARREHLAEDTESVTDLDWTKQFNYMGGKVKEWNFLKINNFTQMN